MRAARSWCGDVVEPAELFPPWTSNEAFIRAIQRDAIESAAKVCDSWQHPAMLRLRAGEMTAQEMRTAKAVLAGVAAAVSALLPPAAEDPKPEGTALRFGCDTCRASGIETVGGIPRTCSNCGGFGWVKRADQTGADTAEKPEGR